MSRLEGITWQGLYAEAYVNAVAFAAGYVCTKTSADSGHKWDFIISGAGASNTMKDPRLEIQVKSTIEDRLQTGESHFTIDRDLHDWARKPRELLHMPRIIALVQLPRTPDEWTSQSDSELISRHCAYWTSLRDAPPLPAGQTSKSIHFAQNSKFNVPGLIDMMTRLSQGEWL